MPLGAPAQMVPKSECSPVIRPMLAIRLSEFGSTGAVETSAFQGLSAGNGSAPPRLASTPSCTALAGLDVTSGSQRRGVGPLASATNGLRARGRAAPTVSAPNATAAVRRKARRLAGRQFLATN